VKVRLVPELKREQKRTVRGTGGEYKGFLGGGGGGGGRGEKLKPSKKRKFQTD